MARPKRRADAPLDLRALNAFVRLARSGSFHEAATQLGISTSALSQTIRTLESQLGALLFDRTTRPVTTTHFGQRLLPEASRLLDDAHALQKRLRTDGHNTPANMRLGCVDSFAATVGPDLIRGLATHDNTLQLYSGLTPDIGAQLLNHRIDFAITSDPMSDSADLLCEPLFRESLIAVFASGQEPSKLESSEALRKVASDLNIIRYTQRSRIGIEIERFLLHHGIRTPRRFEFDGTDTLLSLVSARMGWAITTPLCLLQARHHMSPVTCVPLQGAVEGHRTFYLLRRPDTPSEQATLLKRLTRQILLRKTKPGWSGHPGLHTDEALIEWFD